MCASWQQVCDWAAQVRAQEKPAAAACWGASPPAHRPDDSSTHFSPYFAKKCSYVLADVSGVPISTQGNVGVANVTQEQLEVPNGSQGYRGVPVRSHKVCTCVGTHIS